MKIAIIVSTFPPYKGGMGNSAYEAAKILSKEEIVRVFTPFFCHSEQSASAVKNLTDPSPAARKDNFKVERIKPTWRIGNGAVLLKLYKKLRGYDVIYLHYPFYGTAEIVWLFKIFNPAKKLIIHFHMDTPNLKWWGKILSLPSRIIRKNLMKRADKVISASLDYLAHSSIKDVWKKYPEKFIEIPYGVHLEKFYVLPHDILALQNLRQQYGIKEKERVVMFLGGLDKAHRFKGIDILLRALAQNAKVQTISNYSKTISNVKLLICGGGDMLNDYKKSAAELGIKDKVIFTGRILDEEMVLHYNLADIFALPSIDKSEAFGIVLIEAMACGIPVIASDLPGVRSVFENGVHGYTVAPNSERHLRAKLEEYLKYPSRRWQMGREARRLVEKRYDWKVLGEKFKEVFSHKL